MLGLILLLSIRLMSLRTPSGAALTLVALSSLSGTVIMCAPGMIFQRETNFNEDGKALNSLYSFRLDPNTLETTVVMAPGAGTGIVSAVGSRRTPVYMGNVQQSFLTQNDLRTLKVQPHAQTYLFSSNGQDFSVAHEKRTLLDLTKMISTNHNVDQGRAMGSIPEAGEPVLHSTLSPQWYGYIPRESEVERVDIRITHSDFQQEDMTFQVNEERQLPGASTWSSFRVMRYKLKPDKSKPTRDQNLWIDCTSKEA
ncbi:hypothetical protein PCANC_07958 [Puccinia coronata f. sp. avenae]|uniref:Uncharacterized protein n=1 Tax=Puccinia coronata f. sp. avenae TaxID=200324 RepID=A0A2N5SPY5_9BASI|nr:hypothetical protein PCASD_17025 [Puccinia coronata f. sp. avenae]PLW42815.1 hypothetical protein PCANC_07958 [Puccinia coronata f. sp. avenae]